MKNGLSLVNYFYIYASDVVVICEICVTQKHFFWWMYHLSILFVYNLSSSPLFGALLCVRTVRLYDAVLLKLI